MNSVFVEVRDLGFMTVVANCEGEFDCVITLAVPTYAVNQKTIHELKRCIIQSFHLDPAARYLVKTCQPFQLRDEVYFAEPVLPRRSLLGSQLGSLLGSPNSGISWSNFASRPDEQLYSVPRRYDLAAMFAISVAYAILFAIMRALEAPPTLSFLAGIFFAVIGTAQAILFGGDKPREASIIAGAVTAFASVILFAVIEGVRPAMAVNNAICSVVWGPIAGYLAGTMIGGIWLTADYLPRKNSLTFTKIHTTKTILPRIRNLRQSVLNCENACWDGWLRRATEGTRQNWRHTSTSHAIATGKTRTSSENCRKNQTREEADRFNLPRSPR